MANIKQCDLCKDTYKDNSHRDIRVRIPNPSTSLHKMANIEIELTPVFIDFDNERFFDICETCVKRALIKYLGIKESE